ncbi:MAG: hypothetical protein IRZ28_09385 [Steroidobacteraceae bacterium]|nr:hypothetical protein [Steroidobacteraceae bacterium]
MRHLHRTLLALLSVASLTVAAAEEPRPEDIDPAVDTSAPREPAADAAADTAEAENTSSATESRAAQADAAQSNAAADRTPESTSARATSGGARDRIELDTTQITGNRELPKVLYIVPWKRADLGDLVGKPVNSLLDEVLTPVDRDVFRRENRYYRALMPEDTTAASGAARPSSGGGVARPPEDEM